MVEPTDKELLRLVELDYERSSQFISGVVATAATIRGWMITVWLALLGVAVERGTSELAVLACVVVLVFGVLDVYHTWLYRQALAHARELEKITGAYYNALGRGDGGADPDLALDLQEALESHRFGLYSQMRPFRITDLAGTRPWVFFRFLYPALVVLAITTALLIDAGKVGRQDRDKSDKHATPACCSSAEGAPKHAIGRLR